MRSLQIPGTDFRIIGSSAPMQTLYEQIRRLAQLDIRVLIQGETGVGKELVARALHHLGPNAMNPYVAVNCSALPLDLAESTLFGHRKGAFTGASSDSKGFVKAAEGGTLFLDEIGDMPPQLQPKLLRFLEEDLIIPVGDTLPQKVVTRVLSATNASLRDAFEDGFRRDLFHRIAQYEIIVPPLRERPDDIPEIVAYLHARTRSHFEAKTLGFTEAAVERLKNEAWPGNVRELHAVVMRSIVNRWEGHIDVDDISMNGHQPKLHPVETSVGAYEGGLSTLDGLPGWYSPGVLLVTTKHFGSLPGALRKPTLETRIREGRLRGGFVTGGALPQGVLYLTEEELPLALDNESSIYGRMREEIRGSLFNSISGKPFMLFTSKDMHGFEGVRRNTHHVLEYLREVGVKVVGSSRPEIYAVPKDSLQRFMSPERGSPARLRYMERAVDAFYARWTAEDFSSS